MRPYVKRSKDMCVPRYRTVTWCGYGGYRISRYRPPIEAVRNSYIDDFTSFRTFVEF